MSKAKANLIGSQVIFLSQHPVGQQIINKAHQSLAYAVKYHGGKVDPRILDVWNGLMTILFPFVR